MPTLQTSVTTPASSHTEVDGTTLSTSTRIGYGLRGDGSVWMLGVNGGYDTREMTTGSADTGVMVTNS